MAVIFEMSFLALSNADIQFNTESFTWRFYSIAEALSTTKWIELINKHEFVKSTLDKNSATFVVYIATLKALEPAIHFSQAPLLAVLQQNKASTEISSDYADYANVFSPRSGDGAI